MTEPTKCPRCGTEGCPAFILKPFDPRGLMPIEGQVLIQADLACSARAQTELLRKLIGMVAGCMSNGCLDVTLR